jgi:hypothetical protein
MKFHTVLMVDRNDGRGLVRMDVVPAARANETCMALVEKHQAARAQLIAMPSQSVLFEAFVVPPKSCAWRSSAMAAPAFVKR